MLTGKILITGGAGTLGRAIIKTSKEEDWDCDITIYSTDAMKHGYVRRLYPQVKSVIGDIRDYESLSRVIVGHDIVIHAAAVKHIPVSEHYPVDTYQVNVEGSLNVFTACLYYGIKKVLAISTDKSCHPANAYGASKYLMEKIAQEFSALKSPTSFNLVRYGNVLESTGSVVEVWRKALEKKDQIRITNPKMTRFWLSPSQAVDYVIEAMECDSGHIYIPMMPALSIEKLAEYTLEIDGLHLERLSENIPIRPGEKMHETLLTEEEGCHATHEAIGDDGWYVLRPTTLGRNETCAHNVPYTSDIARQLTKEELDALLND